MKKITILLFILLAGLAIFAGCNLVSENVSPNNDKIPESTNNAVGDNANSDHPITSEINWDNVDVFIPEEEGDINEYTDIIDGSMDESGNFIVAGKSYEYDVTSIKIISDNDFAYFLVELANDLDYYFDLNKKNDNMGGAIGKFVIDIDNNINTGEEEFFTKNTGFDKKLTLYVSTDQDFVYSIGYWLDALPFDFDNRIDRNSEDDSEYLSINHNLIKFKIPLEELEISKNQKLRIMFQEDGGVGSFADTFSDVIIKEIN